MILIGEIRSRETMDYAIAFAGNRSLGFSHPMQTTPTKHWIVLFISLKPDRHSQLYMDLSSNLRAMVAQQLIPTPDGNSRRAAIEILINTPLLADYIRKGEVHEIKDLMNVS